MDVLNAIACSLWEPAIIADDESSRSVVLGPAFVCEIMFIASGSYDKENVN
jgi:hypothetical protein